MYVFWRGYMNVRVKAKTETKQYEYVHPKNYVLMRVFSSVEKHWFTWKINLLVPQFEA